MYYLRIKLNVLLLGLLVMAGATSCKDIIEEDIGDKVVITNAPQSDARYEEGLIQFWWEEVDEALDYRLEIVAGTFAQPSFLELDTTVTSNTYDHFLFAGTYEWRVTAANGSSQTTSESHIFYIDSIENLSAQQIVLTFPADNDCFNASQVQFTWIDLPFVDLNYEFEVRDADFSAGTTFISQLDVTSASYTADVSGLSDGNYAWGVRAKNDNSISSFAVRNFSIDRTAPTTPILSSPTDADSLETNDITLSWSSEIGEESGCSVEDSIYVYTDDQLTSLLSSGVSSSETFTLQGLTTGDYYWYVISLDQAGNASSSSAVFQFFVE